MILTFKDQVLTGVRKIDSEIIDITSNEDWTRIKIHGIELNRYGKTADDLSILRQEIEAENPGVGKVVDDRCKKGEIQASTAVFLSKDKATARRVIGGGVMLAGKRYPCDEYVRGTVVGRDAVRSALRQGYVRLTTLRQRHFTLGDIVAQPCQSVAHPQNFDFFSSTSTAPSKPLRRTEA